VRVIRRIFGVLLALIGLIVAVLGGAAAFWLIGPDNTVRTGEQPLSSKGLAIASTPEMLDRNGPVLHVDVRSTKGTPVFVGVGRDFDVESYLKGTAHSRLVQLEYPIALTTQDVKGTAGPLTAPGTLDWWVAKADGAGSQSIAWPIEDGPYEVVVMNADGKTAPDTRVDLGLEIKGAFSTALGIFAAGLVLLALGILLVLFRRRPAKSLGSPTHGGGYVQQNPPHSTQYPPAAYPPAQPAPEPYPPAQYPPAQQPPAQRPPAQYPPAHGQPPSQGQPPSRWPAGGGTARRVVVVGLALGTVAGCAAVPPADTVTVLTRPAISSSAATDVIAHYNAVNNKANRTRDRKLIATVESGNLGRQSQAGYEIDKAGKAKPTTAFTYTKPTIGAPQYGSYPMSFVSSSGISNDKNYRHLGLWQRQAAGSPWLLSFAAGVKTTVKLPDLADLRPATKRDDTRLAAAPQAAVTALATYLTVGAKSPRAAAFQPNADVTKLITSLAKTRAAQANPPNSVRGITDVFTPPKQSPAYVTKSGTALVFVSLVREHTLLVGKDYNFWWSKLPMTAFSPATVKYQSALTSTTIHDAVLLIPPKGKGKIQVVALESQLVDAGGY